MLTKLEQFKKRNRLRNAHLYADGLIEGYDYVICPISNERMSMIKQNYIIRILNMKPDNYPDIQRVCNKRKDNIKNGLKEIDPILGISKYEIGQIKARTILKQVDKTGKSGYKRKGQKLVRLIWPMLMH